MEYEWIVCRVKGSCIWPHMVHSCFPCLWSHTVALTWNNNLWLTYPFHITLLLYQMCNLSRGTFNELKQIYYTHKLNIHNIKLKLITGLKKRVVRSSGTSRFSFWASNFSFSLAQWAREQASLVPTKSLKEHSRNGISRLTSIIRWLLKFHIEN